MERVTGDRLAGRLQQRILRPLGLPLGRGGQVWGHGGEIAGYATVAFSTADADRQLVLMDNLLPAPGGAVQSSEEASR